MKETVKVAFACGSDELNERLIARMLAVFPELPLYVVSEFPPANPGVRWIRWDVGRVRVNFARCYAALRGKKVRLAGVLMVPKSPAPAMKLLALTAAPLHFLAVNENLNDFLLRPGNLPQITRHVVWRMRNFVVFHWRRETGLRLRIALRYEAARAAGLFRSVPALGSTSGNEAKGAGLVWKGAKEPGEEVLAQLRLAFERVPGLFCASVEFRGLPGVERKESPGEGGFVYALYGGECALYDAAKLECITAEQQPDAARNGRFSDMEALEAGFRAWQRGWPTVAICAAPGSSAMPAPRSEVLAVLCRTVVSAQVFRRLWGDALEQLRTAAATQPAAFRLLGEARKLPGTIRVSAQVPRLSEELFLHLTDGRVAVFAGREARGLPAVVTATPYLPFPLSHGGAVRMYNLMRCAAAEFDQILVVFAEDDTRPAAELLEIFTEIVVVRREGTHIHPDGTLPDAVQDFQSTAFRAALRYAIARRNAKVAQLEFTQLAQYRDACAPARTILVEHDITLDLYRQMAADGSDWEARRQYGLWTRFEELAWAEVDAVVTMSERDRAMVPHGSVAVLPNGVDLERFRARGEGEEARRILFIGSFAHLPNLLAVAWFLREVWPLLRDAELHIIAGARHEYYLEHYRHRAEVKLDLPGITVEGFVSDVRPAYERAAVVIAPLEVSAGTNVKILEAMAMEKPVVSTPAGVNGLALAAGEDFLLARSGAEMAAAIERLMSDEAERRRVGAAARRRVEQEFGWDEIARRQSDLYRGLMGKG